MNKDSVDVRIQRAAKTLDFERLRRAVLLIALLFMMPCYLSAQAPIPIKSVEISTLLDPRGLYSFSYPKTFSPQPRELLRGADILLYYEPLGLGQSSGYPSFNIISEAGPYKADSGPLSSQVERILSSYREVGMAEVKAIGSTIASFSGAPTLQVDVEYERDDKRYISSVFTVSGELAHFILTFIDKAESFESHKELRNQLVSGFQIIGQASGESPPANRWPYLLFVMLFGVATAVFLIFRRRAGR